MEPTAAAAAEAEPEMAPNRALVPMLVMSSAPGSLPRMDMTKSTSRFAMPPWFMMLPARMKNGIAVRLNLLMPTNVRWAAVSTATFRSMDERMAVREETAMAYEMGTPRNSSTSRTARMTNNA